MAVRLGMSARGLQRYEYDAAAPEPRQLLRFMAAAHALRRKDLYEVFAAALQKELDPPAGFRVSVNVEIYSADLDPLPIADLRHYIQRGKKK